MIQFHRKLFPSESTMGIKIAPIHEQQSNANQKNALPPITPNRIVDSSSSSKSTNQLIPNDRHLQGSETPTYLNNSLADWKLDSFEKIEQLPEINYASIKKINRIPFPIDARKILLPDEAERPMCSTQDSGFIKMASPYVQMMKDQGSFSMVMVDPLNSIPKVEVCCNPTYQ